MAGTRTIIQAPGFDGTVVTVEYTFEYDDTWDSYDWDLRPWDVGYRDAADLDLTGDITVDVVGPALFHATYIRWQGNSKNRWREADIDENNTPISFPAGSGPNPRTVGDLSGGKATVY